MRKAIPMFTRASSGKSQGVAEAPGIPPACPTAITSPVAMVAGTRKEPVTRRSTSG